MLTRRWYASVTAVLVCLHACVGVEDAAEQPTEAPPQVVREPVPSEDPVLQFPNEPVWREFWFPIENPARDTSPSTSRVLDAVAARPGMRIADVGAGGGYYTFRWARAVGAEGHVFAIDVDTRMTRKVAWETAAREAGNITTLRVTTGALGLEPSSVDVVAMIDVGAFQTCSPRLNEGYVRQIADALRPGGRFVVMNNATAGEGYSDRPDCVPLSADAIVAAASTRFELDTREDLSKTGWRGYLLRFRPR